MADRTADRTDLLDLLWYDGPAAVLARPDPGAGESRSGGSLGAGLERGTTGDPRSEVAWAWAVALGAVGRYAEAAVTLALLGEARPWSSRAASTRASHLRQVGLHAEAAPLDQRALTLALTTDDRADATSGLVADALGAGDADRAFALLPAAREAAGADGGWRSRTRLFWVIAELSLLVGEPRSAAADADAAVTVARAAKAPRHLTKSLLVRGVARRTQGDTDGAAMDLLTALERARAGGLTSLVWPAAAVAAETVPARAAELWVIGADAAEAITAGLGSAGASFAGRPDVKTLLQRRSTPG